MLYKEFFVASSILISLSSCGGGGTSSNNTPTANKPTVANLSLTVTHSGLFDRGIDVDGSSIGAIEVTNTGAVDINNLQMGFSESSGKEFAVSVAGASVASNLCVRGNVLASGASCNLVIKYAPAVPENDVRQIIVSGDYNDGATSTVPIVQHLDQNFVSEADDATQRNAQFTQHFERDSCQSAVNGNANSLNILWSKIYSSGDESAPFTACIPRAPTFWDDAASDRNVELRNTYLAVKFNDAFKFILPDNIKTILRQQNLYYTNDFDMFLTVQDNSSSSDSFRGHPLGDENANSTRTTHLRAHPWADYNVPDLFPGTRLNRAFNMGVFGGDVIPFSMGNNVLTSGNVHTHDNVASYRGDSQINLQSDTESYVWTVVVDPNYNTATDPYSAGRKKAAVTLTIFVPNAAKRDRVLAEVNMYELFNNHVSLTLNDGFMPVIRNEIHNLLSPHRRFAYQPNDLPGVFTFH